MDESGRPMARARIVVDNQFLYDSNVTGMSGPDGRYRISLPRVASTWNVSATATHAVAGRSVDLSLDPDNPDPFAGNEGAVRNFTVRTSGRRPEGGTYGGTVIVYTPIGSLYEPTEVQLRFEPVDGGAPFTGQIAYTGDGAAVKDVPLGDYRITATRGGRPLRIRVRDQGSYEASVTSGFRQIMTGLFQLQLEVQ